MLHVQSLNCSSAAPAATNMSKYVKQGKKILMTHFKIENRNERMFNSKWQLQDKWNPEYEAAANDENISNKRLEILGQTQQLLMNSLLK